MKNGIRIRELLDGVKYRIVQGSDEQAVSGPEESSLKVKKGSVFFCIRGSAYDGHDFASDAVHKGAGAIITEEEIKLKVKGPVVIKVKDSKAALLNAVKKVYEEYRNSVSVIGITGTKGKTTVSYIVDAILKETFGRDNTVIGTVGYRVGKRKYPAETTTPSNLVLNKLIKMSAAKKIKNVIMEVSSHSLVQGRVENIEFASGVITNVARDHLDYHKTLVNYLSAKLKIISRIKKDGVLVLNRDDSSFAPALKTAQKRGIKTVVFSFEKKADIKVLEYKTGMGGSEFTLEIYGKPERFKTRLVGEHNIRNIMAAIGAVRGMAGIEDIRRAVKTFRRVKGRMETVRNNKCGIIVDFAHTPDSVEKTLKVLKGVCRGRLITVFGAGGGRDRGKRPLMGRAAEKYSDYIIVTSDNPRDENPERIIKDVISGIRNKTSVFAEPDRKKAIRIAVEKAAKDDIVAILGKGHEAYQYIKGKKYPFDDVREARGAAGKAEKKRKRGGKKK
ncbi:MAG TPA: UDP-N-acetylmuramoyl-L-alanyl-D-glutamate--2,6-diaminopimelate ligase [Firmicutes bacterium]|nr:UDP-N-acetylmuramoyl-L-alanyl-D-glutamate--2,6-diaminopimelate ligase [Bacillota bacterium]